MGANLKSHDKESLSPICGNSSKSHLAKPNEEHCPDANSIHPELQEHIRLTNINDEDKMRDGTQKINQASFNPLENSGSSSKYSSSEFIEGNTNLDDTLVEVKNNKIPPPPSLPKNSDINVKKKIKDYPDIKPVFPNKNPNLSIKQPNPEVKIEVNSANPPINNPMVPQVTKIEVNPTNNPIKNPIVPQVTTIEVNPANNPMVPQVKTQVKPIIVLSCSRYKNEFISNFKKFGYQKSCLDKFCCKKETNLYRLRKLKQERSGSDRDRQELKTFIQGNLVEDFSIVDLYLICSLVEVNPLNRGEMVYISNLVKRTTDESIRALKNEAFGINDYLEKILSFLMENINSQLSFEKVSNAELMNQLSNL